MNKNLATNLHPLPSATLGQNLMPPHVDFSGYTADNISHKSHGGGLTRLRKCLKKKKLLQETQRPKLVDS